MDLPKTSPYAARAHRLFKPLALIATVLIASSTLTGCYTTIGGVRVSRRVWKTTEQELQERAAGYLSCDVKDTHLRPLHLTGPYPTDVLAEGCGRHVFYGRSLRHHIGKLTPMNGSGWIMSKR